MKNCKLSMLAVTEERWTDGGKQRLSTGDTIMWSGRKNGCHQEGLALIVNKENSKTLFRGKPVSKRLLYAWFSSKYAKLSVVVANAPTEEADDEIKDSVYTVLQEVMDEILRHVVVIVASDLNRC